VNDRRLGVLAVSGPDQQLVAERVNRHREAVFALAPDQRVVELDQEVNTLGVNTDTGSILLNDGTTDSFLTDAYINNPTVISNNCTKFLTGQ
jgi:hypothetical protein